MATAHKSELQVEYILYTLEHPSKLRQRKRLNDDVAYLVVDLEGTMPKSRK